ncbi:hypothetical protein FKW77_008170 [Venturia effusa]|uniref:Sfi1 spindle body domain-containing protein n=1 Tax=Venturia effusa TaxID=50376 RepID=A0A517LLX3_9PEZI|nr:hypothetical protein FKW77_008170 [Venturia effusa]
MSRPRANTNEITPPQPGQTFENYDEAHLKQGVAYVNQRLNSQMRKPSPPSQKLLWVYKANCEALLRKEGTEKDRSSKAKFLRELEIDLGGRLSWLRATHSAAQQELMEGITRLKRLQSFQRYEDYAARITAAQKKVAFEKKVTGRYLLSGEHKWGNIHREIQAEKAVWDAQGSIEPGKVPTTLAVWEAARDTHLNFDRTVWLIGFYAERNQAFHTDLKSKIKAGHFAKIALSLYHDLSDLSIAIHVEEKDAELVLLGVIKTLMWVWFGVDDKHRDRRNPDAWLATDELKDLREIEILGDKGAQEEKENELAKKMIQELKRVNDATEVLIKQLESGLTIETPNLNIAGPTTKMKLAGRPTGKSPDYETADQWTLYNAFKWADESSRHTRLTSMDLLARRNRCQEAYERRFGINPPLPETPSGKKKN